MAKKENTFTFKENENDLQITVNMKGLMSYIHAIQQFKPNFKAKDILNVSSLDINIDNYITESYKEYLYELIEDSEDNQDYDYVGEWQQCKRN